MLTFVLRRLATGVVLVVAISVATFFLLFATAGDVARNILGGQASATSVTQLRHQLGLDQPVTTQFWHWAGRAVQGDLGESYAGGQPVAQVLVGRLAVTLSLVLGATLVTAVVAVVLGVAAARRGGRVDTIVQVGAVLAAAVPGFLIAIGLVLVFAIGLDLVRPTGYTAFTDSPAQWLSSIVLPVVGLSLSSVAGVVLQVRGAVIDALRQDYVRTLRSRGLSENRVVYRHVLRNAAGPALSVLGLQFVGLIGGAVLVEQLFAIPGIGEVTVAATTQGDLPLVMGVVLVTATLIVLLNLAVDLLCGWLNPKVRLT
ncbi:ABC transporter permease [Streptomyces sp. NPDC013978]|uniref:ABC transporter permease n=1 Tax=Streptomyces sp. NPDC013978 TaxID=3364869 RepID=UPI0036FB1ADD